MKARDRILPLQVALLIPEALRTPKIGPLTRGAFARLSLLGPDDEFDQSIMAPSVELGHAGSEGARDITEKGAQFVQSFEGLWLTGALDSGGVATIGWGHTGLQHEDGTVYVGRKITQEKAWQLFRYDMEQFEARVCAFVKVPLKDHEYDALVSFDFNTGGLGKSTLLKRLNAGDREAAADEFLRWDKDGGKTVHGLTRRRMAERNIFLTGRYEMN
ncbi:MAG: lysozyme [Chthoniobacter sp.]|jgi:GH24 family phage-related lysozyme (muramidase)|nr:lysozyme [Chthoniobacter sp.]